MGTPRQSRHRCLPFPVRAQIVGMSQAVCLFACSTSSAFGTVSEDAPGEALVSALPWGRQGGMTLARSRPDCGGCLRRFVCLAAWTSALSKKIARIFRARRRIQHPMGKPPGGYDTRLFAARCQIVGMCQAVCMFLPPPQTSLPSEQNVDMFRGAGFSTPRGSRHGGLHSNFRAQIVGMSQAVCLFWPPGVSL